MRLINQEITMKPQTITTTKQLIISCHRPGIWASACLLSLGLAWAPPTLAAELACGPGTTPMIHADAAVNCFVPNTIAKSGQVNANFERLLQHIDTLQQSNQNLQQRLAALEAKLAAVSDSSTADHLLIEGANVQITNGAGRTNTTNSKGNLIIGYNAAATRDVCSNGSGNNQADCQINGGIWDSNQRQGSHNVVIGNKHQYSQYAGLVAGFDNAVVGTYASVSGGLRNTASEQYASVSGGYNNTATALAASVSGGLRNTASGSYASVSGGYNNTASGESTSVSGGRENTATAISASVSGGFQNNAAALSASVSGGYLNTASGNGANVSAGFRNTAEGYASSVIGSQNQTAAGNYSIAP